MVKMDLVPDSHILTSLFNACATSPLRNDALKRAHKLRMTMIIQGCEPHVKTYGAMINAFAGCGDTEMALSLVDEALQTHRPSQNFLNCALSACVSDKEAGFRHAIQVPALGNIFLIYETTFVLFLAVLENSVLPMG